MMKSWKQEWSHILKKPKSNSKTATSFYFMLQLHNHLWTIKKLFRVVLKIRWINRKSFSTRVKKKLTAKTNGRKSVKQLLWAVTTRVTFQTVQTSRVCTTNYCIKWGETIPLSACPLALTTRSMEAVGMAMWADQAAFYQMKIINRAWLCMGTTSFKHSLRRGSALTTRACACVHARVIPISAVALIKLSS
jgi:hypothetical protein